MCVDIVTTVLVSIIFVSQVKKTYFPFLKQTIERICVNSISKYWMFHYTYWVSMAEIHFLVTLGAFLNFRGFITINTWQKKTGLWRFVETNCTRSRYHLIPFQQDWLFFVCIFLYTLLKCNSYWFEYFWGPHMNWLLKYRFQYNLSVLARN